MSKQQLDPEIYDDEAFVGLEEGELLDGKVVDDLNDEGALACLLACSDKLYGLHAAVTSLQMFRLRYADGRRTLRANVSRSDVISTCKLANRLLQLGRRSGMPSVCSSLSDMVLVPSMCC